MSWGIAPQPGQESGPCKKACSHFWCGVMRQRVKRPCIACNQKIGYDRRYRVVGAFKLVHERCKVV